MRLNRFCRPIDVVVALAILILPLNLTSRALYDVIGEYPIGKASAGSPFVTVGVHNIGKIALTVNNEGNFGTGFVGGVSDPLTGGPAPSCTFPYPGRASYLFAGAFWIGAIVGRDTLVSVGADGWHGTKELWPDALPRGQIINRSITHPEDSDAVSEQDYIAIYTDTLTSRYNVEIDPFDNRPHIPLGVEVTQRSYAWSYSYAEDFVLFDYSIKNIGTEILNKVYMGFYVDADVQQVGSATSYDDDVCGFKRAVPSASGCGFIDTIDIAWIADNDGKQLETDPCPSNPADFSNPGSGYLTSVTGMRVVRTPSDSLKLSFNWWISNGAAVLDFGPRKAGTPEDPFRDFGGFLGTPEGDRNKYYTMRHEEFDYDELLTDVDHTSEGWLPRPDKAADMADGYDTRYLLSFGPFDIAPGEILPITFAYVGGENFHTDCNAFKNLFRAEFPDAFNNYLNYEDFGKNALWASWIYDNPGVATSGDTNNRGKYRICVLDSIMTFDTIQTDPLVIDTTLDTLRSDTTWYEGDGIPDFKGASPPPPPKMWVYPRINEYNEGELRVRFNGLKSETTKDVFSQIIDFEGYRLYVALTSRPSDFVLTASWDVDDYERYIWNSKLGVFEAHDIPFSLDSLRALYGPNFNPMSYSREMPFKWQDTILIFFKMKDWNVSDTRNPNGIHKIYPDELRPLVLNVDTARIYHPEQLTEDGYFKYFEYEYTIKHLLPSQLYYVAMTTFDFGSPGSGLESLESTPRSNMIAEYPQTSSSLVESKKLNVIVYPNPYRMDANYQSTAGGSFEGREQGDQAPDRLHRIHFMNLPHKCKIRIFTLDGDLVREIDHDMPANDPQSMHATWDLITRNTQLVASGIYYYSVESESGNQLGKLVIIL